MPTYGYECTECNEQFEVVQRMTEPSLTVHESCGGSLRKLLYPVGIVFKGPGFHVNDYARKSSNGAKSEAAESKPESTVEAKTETKSEATTEVKSDSKPVTSAAPSPAVNSVE